MIIPLFPETGNIETFWATVSVIVVGLIGALCREILDDTLTLPTVKDNILSLGFIGSLIIGGAAGYFLADSLVGAFTAGLTAATLLGSFIKK